ncbi:MAG: hypothetical protein FGM27_06725 [Candidatus Omnitrophica bacterium]|nr:hypothetical protein [Candidatus Omnitrophota bacterium]
MALLLDFTPLFCFFFLAWLGLRKLPKTPAFFPPRVFLVLILGILSLFVVLMLLIKYGFFPGLSILPGEHLDTAA